MAKGQEQYSSGGVRRLSGLNSRADQAKEGSNTQVCLACHRAPRHITAMVHVRMWTSCDLLDLLAAVAVTMTAAAVFAGSPVGPYDLHIVLLVVLPPSTSPMSGTPTLNITGAYTGR